MPDTPISDKRSPDVIELERLDNCGDQFHTRVPASILVGSATTANRRCTFRATARPARLRRLSAIFALNSVRHGTNSAPSGRIYARR